MKAKMCEFRLERTDIDTMLDIIEVAGEQIKAKDVELILTDPSSLAFLELAIAGVRGRSDSGRSSAFHPGAKANTT